MESIGSLSELRAALWRQSWLILLVLALGLPAVYVYAKRQPSIYEATGVLGLNGLQETPAVGGLPIPIIPATERLNEVQQALLSREIMADLVDRLGLFPGAESENVSIALLRGSITINRLVDPAMTWRPDAQPYGLAISVRLEDPEQAAALANALLDLALEEDSQHARARMAANIERTSELLDYLTNEESRIGDEIARVEAEIVQYRMTNAASLPENRPFTREELAGFEAQLRTLDGEIIGFERTGSRRPSEATERFRSELEADRAELTAEIAEAEAAIADGPEVERQLGALTRRLNNLEVELDAIVMQRTQVATAQNLSSSVQEPILFVDEAAIVPEFPASSSRRKIAAAGAAAVFCAALGLAFAREFLHPVIRTAAQMQRQLNIEPVVIIPHVASPMFLRWRLAKVAVAFLGVLALAYLLGPARFGQATSERLLGLWPSDTLDAPEGQPAQ